MALLLFSAPLAAAVGELRSSRQLAREIGRDYERAIEVVAIESFPASLPFYLGRSLVVQSIDGAHLRSNYIERRYAQLADDAGALRSVSWLGQAMLDCATPRVFVVRRRNEGVRKLLAATGRPLHEGKHDFLVFGPCATAAAAPVTLPGEVLEELAAPPPAELLPPAAFEAGRVPE
jgi:hypothetical protein